MDEICLEITGLKLGNIIETQGSVTGPLTVIINVLIMLEPIQGPCLWENAGPVIESPVWVLLFSTRENFPIGFMTMSAMALKSPQIEWWFLKARGPYENTWTRRCRPGGTPRIAVHRDARIKA